MGDEEIQKNTACNLEGLVNWFLKCLVVKRAEQELLSVLESSGDPISETLQRKELGPLTHMKEPQDHFPFPKEENKPEEASVSPTQQSNCWNTQTTWCAMRCHEMF